jgi:TldD protein
MKTDQFDAVIKTCRELGDSQSLYEIVRIQQRTDLTVHINNWKTEEINTGSLCGMGIQVFTKEGNMGFAASDQVSETIAANLLRKAAFLARTGAGYHTESNREVFKLTSLSRKSEIPLKHPHDSMSLGEIETKLRKLNQELMTLDSRLSVRTLLRLTNEEWRIGRSDKTDVSFNTPRAFVFHSLTAKSGSNTATTYANISGNDLSVLVEPDIVSRLKRRAKKAAGLGLKLLEAPKFSGGNYKMVIDYALAKGLAHEAFGHAAETDGMESSILGESGRFRKGIKVADSRLSIIDGPVEGDYAYQPMSAVGLERQTVKIVDHGILNTGLADIFSAARAGVPPTGAERVASFFHLPIARMSNIRIEFEDPIPLDQEFENVTPEDLYDVMTQHGLMKPGEKVLYLTGFQGGQVNPAFGDFVFNCSAIYELTEKPVLYKAAIFSGKILSVLQSVSAAIGDLQLDAMGTCGKMGQGVPSCGGSHYFLVIDQNPDVMIGGE